LASSGFVDDYLKVARKTAGARRAAKFALQVLVALVVAVICRSIPVSIPS